MKAIRTQREQLLPVTRSMGPLALTRSMASYLSAERGATIDLTDPVVTAELDAYILAIQQGRGHAQLLQARGMAPVR